MANRIFQRYNNLLSEATFLRQYYSKSYITDLKQTFINLQLSQRWVYFAKYAKRKAVETIEATARQAALQRALLGEVVSESNYHALCNQLIEAATVLSQDNQNGQWLKGHLNDTLIDLKYSAGLSNELSESIVRKLCEGSKKLDENHINM